MPRKRKPFDFDWWPLLEELRGNWKHEAEWCTLRLREYVGDFSDRHKLQRVEYFLTHSVLRSHTRALNCPALHKFLAEIQAERAKLRRTNAAQKSTA